MLLFVILWTFIPSFQLSRQGRFKRSNSVTAAVQADLELECFPTMEDKGLQFGGGFQRHSEPSTPTQYGAVRTVRTQGLFSYRDDYRTPAEPPSPRETTSETTWQLEPPSPRESAASSGETGRVSPSLRRDGSWFMQLLHTETKRMESWCKEMEAEAEENDLSEDSECSAPNLTFSSAHRGKRVTRHSLRLCFSSGKNPKRSGECSAAHVSEIPAVLLAVSAKPGKT